MRDVDFSKEWTDEDERKHPRGEHGRWATSAALSHRDDWVRAVRDIYESIVYEIQKRHKHPDKKFDLREELIGNKSDWDHNLGNSERLDIVRELARNNLLPATYRRKRIVPKFEALLEVLHEHNLDRDPRSPWEMTFEEYRKGAIKDKIQKRKEEFDKSVKQAVRRIKEANKHKDGTTAKYWEDMIGGYKETHENWLELAESNRAYGIESEIEREYEKCLEWALKNGEKVAPEILLPYSHKDWMPKSGKDIVDRYHYREMTKRDIRTFKSVGNENLFRDHAEGKLGDIRKIMGDAINKHADSILRHHELTQLADQLDKSATPLYQEMIKIREAAGAELNVGGVAYSFEEVLALPVSNEHRKKYVEKRKAFNDAMALCKEFRERADGIRASLNQNFWNALAKPDTKTVSLRWNEGGEFENFAERHEEAKNFFETLAAASVFGDVVTVNVRKLPKGQDRAYASGNAIYIRDCEPTSIIAHEVGHVIESADIAKMSRSHVLHATRHEPEHLGGNHDNDEMYLPSKPEHGNNYFYSRYSAKWYPYTASEVLSVGVEQLFNEPYEFVKNNPNHAAYVIGVLRGDITSPPRQEE